jgi:2-iminobutanoate/2-iminopropanoate deaminase
VPSERIFPEGAVKPRGPYSPAVRAGDFIYVSGQGPADPEADRIGEFDIGPQTRQTILNIQTILAGCGATLSDVVKCSVFLKHAGDFHAMNQVYAEFFGEHRPARTTVEAKFHNHDMLIEMDCVAYKPQS